MSSVSRFLEGVALVAVLTLGGCPAPDVAFPVAVGASGILPQSSGPCHGDRGALSGIFETERGDDFVARKTGIVRIECRDGVVVFDSRPAERLVLDGPPKMTVGEETHFRVYGVDYEGQFLSLGEMSDVAWSFSGALVAGGNCGSATCERALAEHAGEGEIFVTFRELRGRFGVLVLPKVDDTKE